MTGNTFPKREKDNELSKESNIIDEYQKLAKKELKRKIDNKKLFIFSFHKIGNR